MMDANLNLKKIKNWPPKFSFCSRLPNVILGRFEKVVFIAVFNCVQGNYR